MASATPRFGLPNLYVAQAQKEVTHNEALFRIDALLHCSVEASLSSPPSVTAQDAGKCWLIATAASGSWQGKESQVACWTGESWRFLEPREGMRLWRESDGIILHFLNGIWRTPASINNPAGGSAVDAEVRAAVSALLAELRQAGLLTS